MNGKETSLQSNPNQWLHIWFAQGRKIIQIVDRFTLQHFVNQKHLFQWVENEGHDIKGSGLERKNIVTSAQILSVVIAM